MIHVATVALPPEQVLARAKAFFAERNPNGSAFVEKEAPDFLSLRGQGGEEIVIRAVPLEGQGAEDGGSGKSRVRASTLLFDQGVDRFLCTLPLESGVEVT